MLSRLSNVSLSVNVFNIALKMIKQIIAFINDYNKLIDNLIFLYPPFDGYIISQTLNFLMKNIKNSILCLRVIKTNDSKIINFITTE